MNGKSWTIFIIIVIAVIGGMVYLSTQIKLNIDDIDDNAMARFIDAEERNGNIADHTLGNKDAKVVLIEYGDYQCPGCSTAAPKAKAVAEKYSDDMVLIFRNFPISNSHPNARAAAAVAESAAFQGKFWEMHDMIYANQDSWSQASASDRTNVFLGYARELKLNEEQLKKDLSEPRITKKINFDVALGRKQGVSATPSFYLNGKPVEATNDADYLETAVKEELKKAGVKIEDKESAEK